MTEPIGPNPFRATYRDGRMEFVDNTGACWQLCDFTPLIGTMGGLATVPAQLDDDQRQKWARLKPEHRQVIRSKPRGWFFEQYPEAQLISDNLELWLDQQANAPDAGDIVAYPLGHPAARRRAFLRIRQDGGDGHRVCDLRTVGDHRWYADTIREQFEHTKSLRAGVMLRPAKESPAALRLVPLRPPLESHSHPDFAHPDIAFVHEDGAGLLWVVQDAHYGSDRRRGMVCLPPGSDEDCQFRIFSPLEHEAGKRIFKFDTAGRHPIPSDVGVEFGLSREARRAAIQP